jgi:hypothetical protein
MCCLLAALAHTTRGRFTVPWAARELTVACRLVRWTRTDARGCTGALAALQMTAIEHTKFGAMASCELMAMVWERQRRGYAAAAAEIAEHSLRQGVGTGRDELQAAHAAPALAVGAPALAAGADDEAPDQLVDGAQCRAVASVVSGGTAAVDDCVSPAHRKVLQEEHINIATALVRCVVADEATCRRQADVLRERILWKTSRPTLVEQALLEALTNADLQPATAQEADSFFGF